MNLKLIQQWDFFYMPTLTLNLLWTELLYIFKVYNVRAAIMKERKPHNKNIWILISGHNKNWNKTQTRQTKNHQEKCRMESN